MAQSPTKIAVCPPTDTIAQLVSGSLDEADAERLFRHIDECSTCQNTLEQLERRADGVLEKARRLSGSAADQKQLSGLIRRAQDLGSRDSDITEPERQTVPIGNFVTSLKRCGLFEQEEVDSLLTEMDTADSSTIAKLLISRKKLTPFQARVLLKGRWKGLVLGNYELLDKLGQGGMGSVFRARHRRLGRIVCVKVMNSAGRKSPQMIERFRNEARTVAALSHPNFVVAHDADEAEGVPFLVMEYVEGSDLAKYVSAQGPLPVEGALQVTLQAAAALQYAHDEGVTHRDIKPHNLLLSQDSESGEHTVKILDMGLARFDALLCDNPDASTHAAMTNTGVIMGTVDYMSPEQAVRSRDADNRSDIYSLGCTLHFLLTGRPVYTSDTIMARLIAHREDPIPSLVAECPTAMPQLDSVFRKMLAKLPAERYQSMQEVVNDITAVLKGEDPVAHAIQPDEPESILEQRRQLRRKPTYGVWLLLAGLFCLIGTGVWAAVSRPWETVAETTETMPPEMTPEMFAVPPGPGDHGTIVNGGRGEVLLIVPYGHYHDDECRAWEAAVQDQGMYVSYATSTDGIPHPKHDTTHVIDSSQLVSLEHVPPNGFDCIFLVGGTTDEFYQKPQANFLDSVLLQSLADGAVIGRLENVQYHALEHAVDICRNRDSLGVIRYSAPVYQQGAVLSVNELKEIPELVQKAKELRVTQREKRKTGATSMLDTLDRLQERRRGGAGRALMVIPAESYHTHEYEALRKELDDRGISTMITSSEFGSPEPDKRGRRGISTDITLDQFLPEYFDVVFLVGGSVNEFHKKDAFRKLEYVVSSALDNGLVVAATSKNTDSLLNLLDLSKHLKQDVKGQVVYGNVGDQVGSLAAISETKYMNALVRNAVDQRDEAIRKTDK